jgi:hypothetical protein
VTARAGLARVGGHPEFCFPFNFFRTSDENANLSLGEDRQRYLGRSRAR